MDVWSEYLFLEETQFLYFCPVRLKKALISSVLLLVYAFSFAHELIPHCHHALGVSGEPHVHLAQHEHYAEGDQHDDDHSHNSHRGGHSKTCLNGTEDIFCFLSCWLSETEHSGSDAGQHLLLPETESNPLNDRLKVQLASVLTILFDFHEDNAKVVPQPEVKDFYSPPLLAHSPHRGPPSISC